MFKLVLLAVLLVIAADKFSFGSASEEGECLKNGEGCPDQVRGEGGSAAVVAGSSTVKPNDAPLGTLPPGSGSGAVDVVKPGEPTYGQGSSDPEDSKKPKPNKPQKPKPNKPGRPQKPKPQKPKPKPQKPKPQKPKPQKPRPQSPGGKPNKPRPQRPGGKPNKPGKPQKPKPNKPGKPQKPKPNKPGKPQKPKPQRPQHNPIEQECIPLGYACNCDCCRGYCAETNFGPTRYCIKLDANDPPPIICKKETPSKPTRPPPTTAPPAHPVAALPVVGGELASQSQNPGATPSGGSSGGGQPSGVPGPSSGASGGSSGAPGPPGGGQAQGVENIPVVGGGLQQGASGAKP